MSMKLKRDFFWMLKNKEVVVYSDEGRFFRDNFVEKNPTITPHNAIEMAKKDESVKIDTTRVGSNVKSFLVDVLLENNVKQNQIIL